MSDELSSAPMTETLEEPPRPALRALIVDDDATTVLLLRRALADAGFEVAGYTSNGADAIRMARETQPDFILMDYSMPGMDGAETTRQIMAERRVPIVMLTGHSDPEHVNQALEAGASTYLVKPINRGLLLPAIQTALDVFAVRRP